MDRGLQELLDEVEKYVQPIISENLLSSFSKEENRILALQRVHRLNLKIGMLARSNKEKMEEMKTLQDFVNSLTIGLKSNNVPQMRFGLTRAKNMITSLS